MSAERRKYRRIKVPMPILVNHASMGTFECTTKNISDGGLSLEPPDGPFPRVGEEVTIQITKGLLGGSHEEPINARVIHVSKEMIGISYV